MLPDLTAPTELNVCSSFSKTFEYQLSLTERYILREKKLFDRILQLITLFIGLKINTYGRF